MSVSPIITTSYTTYMPPASVRTAVAADRATRQLPIPVLVALATAVVVALSLAIGGTINHPLRSGLRAGAGAHHIAVPSSARTRTFSPPLVSAPDPVVARSR